LSAAERIAVGNGSSAVVKRRLRFAHWRPESIRSIRVKALWWLSQITPM